MSMLIVDGRDLPSPASMGIPKYDIDSANAGRDETGVMHRDRVRSGIYKLELEWTGLSSSELQAIDSAISKDSLKVTFPTPKGMLTKTMYAGDRNISMVMMRDDGEAYWDMSVNLIEF